MNIVSAAVAPNPVKTGASVYIGVEINDEKNWLLENQDLFLITTTGEFLLTTEVSSNGDA